MLKLTSTIVLAILLLLVTTVAVEAGGQAAAFSGYGNPERGFCVGPDVTAAAICAVDACMKSGGKTVECAQLRTCAFPGWSMSVSLVSKDGYKWEEFHCGFPSQASALTVLRIMCNKDRMNALRACRIASLADPDGNLMPIK
jgi:hypothetical protein